MHGMSWSTWTLLNAVGRWFQLKIFFTLPHKAEFFQFPTKSPKNYRHQYALSPDLSSAGGSYCKCHFIARSRKRFGAEIARLDFEWQFMVSYSTIHFHWTRLEGECCFRRIKLDRVPAAQLVSVIDWLFDFSNEFWLENCCACNKTSFLIVLTSNIVFNNNNLKN